MGRAYRRADVRRRVCGLGDWLSAGLAVWRAPATPSGLAAALAVTLFTAFAFGKKAFCNYYVLVLAVLVLAIAAAAADDRRRCGARCRIRSTPG